MVNNINNEDNAKNLPFKVERLYLKEIILKLPHAPNVFENSELKQKNLAIDPALEMNIKSQRLSIDKFEVTLHAIVSAKSHNISLFNIEVQQSGIFTINSEATEIENIIKNYCIAILHPYLNQVINNNIIQAGFPPIILQPFNVSNLEKKFNPIELDNFKNDLNVNDLKTN